MLSRVTRSRPFVSRAIYAQPLVATFSKTTPSFQKQYELRSEEYNGPLSKIKLTTTIVGVPVQERWRPMLLKLGDDVLKALEQIPKGTYYRTVTENNFRFFQKVISENDDYEVVEHLINRGQVEQLILMYEDELELIPKMAEWKPWEVSEQDVILDKDDIQHNEDYSFAPDYIAPKLKYHTWDGSYQVELSQEDLDKKEEQRKKEEAEAEAEEKRKQEEFMKKK
ncbi:NADH dehydrogenase [ubiquinone] 1 alpha subcomplex subunit 5, mitochondrial [Acrasis kona]|uniref:NADH dehydrogenase [ubiquinone] 1 alpha subcomplex subunit 5, mitochondrial n=1 Tax=Acrasis kona TaxID=1008807 RepID=A0AAW2ZN42_9EUKA